MNICQGYYNPTIYKVIWHHISTNVEDKYIFIGHPTQYSKEQIDAFKRLEIGGYSAIKDAGILSPFKNQFGNIVPGHTHFIYSSIADQDCVNHVMEDIASHLGILPENMYMWYNPRSITDTYFHTLVMNIFRDEKLLKRATFIKRLLEVSGDQTLDDLKAFLLSEFSGKYKSVTQITFFDSDNYHIDQTLYNDDFRLLLTSFPISLSTCKYFLLGSQQIAYINHINPIRLNSGLSDDISDIPEKLLEAYEDQIYKQLISSGKPNNNEFYLVTSEDFKHAKPKILKYYFPEERHISSNQDLRNSVSLNIPSNLKKIVESSLEVTSCAIKDIIISVNSIGLTEGDGINLVYLFNKLRTYRDMPVIQIYQDWTLVNTKLNKEFIDNEPNEIIDKMLAASALNSNLPNYRGGENYLLFIFYLEKNSYMNVYLFADNIIKIVCKFLNYTSITRVKGFLNIVNILIRKIIAATNSRAIKTLELSALFDGQSINIPNTTMEYTKMMLDYRIKSLSFNDKFMEIVKRFKLLHRYVSFINSNVVAPSFYLIYKSSDDFYHPNNIRAFIANYKNKKGGSKLTLDDAGKLETILEQYFYISKKVAKQLITDTDASSDLQFNFGCIVELTISRANIVVHFDKVHSFSSTRKFIQLLNLVLCDVFQKTSTDSIIEIKPTSSNTVSVDSLLSLDDITTETDDIDYSDEATVSSAIADIAEVSESAELSLDYLKNAKGKGLKFSSYMSQMREKMDPELYHELETYNKSCPAREMRQPYIVSKKELDTFDPNSITGAMKYRGNYYICPRIWDYKARKPISVEEFTANGMKSPYTGGVPIPPGKRSEHELDDKYTVIIRKPRTAGYWDDPKVEKNWPTVLKGTGVDAYPGLINMPEHPKKFCAPCCYKHRPGDYDPNASSVRIFKEFYGWEKCKVGVGTTEDVGKGKKIPASENPKCLNENYILDKTADLENCRLGLLPDNLDLLLNNNQSIFLNQNHNSLRDNANCFLKRGVFFDGKTSNFLRCIDNIKEFYNMTSFKRTLVKALTPELFITLNGGDLVKLYCSNDLLPNMSNPSKVEAFKQFIERSPALAALFNVSSNDLDKMDSKYRSIITLYQIMTAHMNYINHLLDPEDSMDYRHLLDFISRPIDTIFPSGVNIIIFDKSTQKIQCNPYTHNTRNVIILINEDDIRFTPIYHIRVKMNNIKLSGVIRITESINLDEQAVHYYNNVTKNPTLVAATRTRVNYFQNLYFIHSSMCYANKKDIEYRSVSELVKLIGDCGIKDFFVSAQVLVNTAKVQYLVLADAYLLPIYPTYISLETEVKFLNADYLRHTLSDTWTFYERLSNAMNVGKQNLDYVPTKILVNFVDNSRAIGIEFANGLMVPIKPQSIPTDPRFSATMIKPHTFYVENYEGLVNDKVQVQRLLLQDYIYQQFKYEFSLVINEYKNKEKKNNLKSADANTLVQLIHEIMAPIVSIKSMPKDSVDLVPGLSIGACYTIKNASMCAKNPMCDQGNHCGLGMNKEMLELFSYLLAQDMLNNVNERYFILDGKFIPLLPLSRRLFSRPDEILTGTTKDLTHEIARIKKEAYHRNLPLTQYLGKTYSTHIVSNQEYERIKHNIDRERLKSINKLSNILANISLDYLLPEHLIIATPFDADGRINIHMNTGPCIFPYLDTSNYKLVYGCMKNEKKLMTCPTLLNLDRKPVKWGYCPEDPDITKHRMGQIPVNAISDSRMPEYKSGRCIFPFLDKQYNLSYECKRDIDSSYGDFMWCPIKFKNSGDFAPVAATEIKDIWRDKWKFRNVFKPNTSKIAADFMEPIGKGLCQPPKEYGRKSIEEMIRLDPNEDTLTISSYQPMNCMDTPSKGGYSREQLYLFGKNVLKLPHTMLKKGSNILGKEQLCAIINNQIREIKREDAQKQGHQHYTRDISKCLLGEKKGGYKLQELRELAVQHYSLDSTNASNMSKEQLCEYLTPLINVQDKTYNQGVPIEEPYLAYKKNIDLCVKSKKRGGYGRKELIDIANKKMGLHITNDMLKDEICKKVKARIEELKAAKTSDERPIASKKQILVSKRIRTLRLERAKTLKDLESNAANTNNIPIRSKLTKHRLRSNTIEN